MKEKVITLVISFMLCLISGCGCNDDDNGGDGYFPIDTTPPVITLVFPEDGVGDVAVNTSITVTFSEEMNPVSINDSTFTVSGLAGSVTYEAATMTATFQPSGFLAYDTTYTATITSGAEDLAGNPLNSNYEWNFTTDTAYPRFAYVVNMGNNSVSTYAVENDTGRFRY
ncbi:MAG: Ig-like domain-containing protein [Spirochaetota bacterium]|nr:Ig-like domain-containing protein [Spirochaetota bacterium]